MQVNAATSNEWRPETLQASYCCFVMMQRLQQNLSEQIVPSHASLQTHKYQKHCQDCIKPCAGSQSSRPSRLKRTLLGCQQNCRSSVCQLNIAFGPSVSSQCVFSHQHMFAVLSLCQCSMLSCSAGAVSVLRHPEASASVCHKTQQPGQMQRLVSISEGG